MKSARLTCYCEDVNVLTFHSKQLIPLLRNNWQIMVTPMLLMVVTCTSRPFHFGTVHKLLNQFDYEKRPLQYRNYQQMMFTLPSIRVKAKGASLLY